MKKIAIIAALAASIAAPAFAQSSSTAFAIAHFNQTADSLGDVVAVPGANAANRSSGTLSEAFAIFNQTADTPSQLRGVVETTPVSAQSAARAQDIFARLRAESAEGE